MEDAETEEVKLSPSIHLPFQAFEPIDVPFNLTLIPWLRTRRLNRGVIAARMLLARLFSSLIVLPLARLNQSLPRLRLVLFEESYEILTELIRDGEFLTCLTHLLNLPLLCSSQLLLSENKQKGGLVGERVDDVLEQEEESHEPLLS